MRWFNLMPSIAPTQPLRGAEVELGKRGPKLDLHIQSPSPLPSPPSSCSVVLSLVGKKVSSTRTSFQISSLASFVRSLNHFIGLCNSLLGQVSSGLSAEGTPSARKETLGMTYEDLTSVRL